MVQATPLLGLTGSRSAVLQGFVDGLEPGDAAVLESLLEAARERRIDEPPGTRRE